MTVSTIKMTAQQFLDLGEDPPGIRLELVDGEVAVSPSPAPEHSYVDTQLRTILNLYVKSKRLGLIFGDVDTIFGKHDVRRPDIIFFQTSRRRFIGEKSMNGAPDLCVEIISPGSVKVDRKDKFEQYAVGNVRYYWIVDPARRTIEAFRLRGGKYAAAGRGLGIQSVTLPPFPDLEIPLADLWLPKSLS